MLSVKNNAIFEKYVAWEEGVNDLSFYELDFCRCRILWRLVSGLGFLSFATNF